ncbi:non-homologous end joining protein Ku [Terrihabitans sp. B22-R8]|uniref:non-homologous end joining protein Ku n=1 Tax=Terrihabitans sp. B22-R8 TaxID=3425128 RepID=UPI00403D2BED
MAPRSSWKGYLKLSLVSCAVALYPATTTSERVSFNTLNRSTGNRLKQQMIDSETDEVVEREDRARGYEFSKGHYVLVEDEDIEKVQIESSHTIEIDRFVPESEIDEIYYEGSHYLAPDDKVAEEAFAVIREAMAQEKVVGLARLVLARRERIVALHPRGKGILVTTLRFKNEVRDDDAYFESISDVKIDEEMMDLATHIIGRKRGHFEPATFEDRYENAVVEMLKAKQQGREIEAPKAQKAGNVVSLMDALRRSIETEKAGAADKPATKGKAPAAKAADKEKTPARRPAARSVKRAGEAAPSEKKSTRKRASG